MPAADVFRPGLLAVGLRETAGPALSENSEGFVFPYREDGKIIATERWDAAGGLWVPSTGASWLMASGSSAQVRSLFLGCSGTELLCFCQLHAGWLRLPGAAAFAALGLLPSMTQVQGIRSLFPKAKVHLLFDAALTGRVADCLVALWLKGKWAEFVYAHGRVTVSFQGRRIDIPETSFSLNRFEKEVGIRTGIRTHKPRNGANSFLEYLSTNH